MPFFAAIPAGTAIEAKGLDTIPAAGPYYVASRAPGRMIVIKKNPYYKGSRPAKAVLYTCTRPACTTGAAILQYNLKQIGLDLDVRTFATPVQIAKLGTKGEPFDIGFHAWVADYADPFDFINVLLDGSNIQNTGNVNFSYFDDPKYLKKMKAAAELAGADRAEAYGKLDIELAAKAAPLAAWANANARVFVSGKVGCYTYNPVYGTDLAALCLK